MEVITFVIGLCIWAFAIIGVAHVLKNGFCWPAVYAGLGKRTPADGRNPPHPDTDTPAKG